MHARRKQTGVLLPIYMHHLESTYMYLFVPVPVWPFIACQYARSYHGNTRLMCWAIEERTELISLCIRLQHAVELTDNLHP